MTSLFGAQPDSKAFPVIGQRLVSANEMKLMLVTNLALYDLSFQLIDLLAKVFDQGCVVVDLLL